MLIVFLMGVGASAQVDTLTKISWYKNGQRFPMDVSWINSNRSIDPILQNDRMYLLNFYSPSALGSSEITSRFLSLARKYTTVQLVNILIPQHPAEMDSVNIREHLYRHQMHYPVMLTDSLAVFAQHLGNVSPITSAVLFARGRVAREYKYMQDYKFLENDIDSLLELTTEALDFSKIGRVMESEVTRIPKPVIGFPSAMVASEKEARMYLTDLQKHRIIVLEADGQVNEMIGSGLKGFQDGRFSTAKFNTPQGITLDEKNRVLYVADTHNHAIRMVSLNTGEVTTILGNGSPAQQSTGEVAGTTAPILFPTGLALGAGKLYIAMSGFNQIWELDLKTTKAKAIAGSGKALSNDGIGLEADLNEPTAISFDDDGLLYLLESRTGDVRTLNLEGEVKTVFDNSESKVKLQNPKDILINENGIFISDCYNNQIKQLVGGEVIALNGKPVAGWTDGKPGKASLNEPHGLAYMNGIIYIADYGNSLIRTFTTKKSKLGTMKITKLGPMTRYEEAITQGRKIYLGPLKIGDGKNKITLYIEGGDDFNLLLTGRNEADISDTRGHNTILSDRVGAGEVVFESQGDVQNQYILAELYLTFKDKLKDEANYYMPVNLLIMLDYEPGNAVSETVNLNISEFLDGKY